MSFKRNLPSINALVTLEAATRLKSFTAAARELNVTQAAVSRQIRSLEEELGAPLFQRSHRRVEPTLVGGTLGGALNRALEIVQETVDRVRQASDGQTLTVGATLAFSHFWLLPRLPKFRERHPELKIRIVSQDEPLDLRAGEIDVLLRFGIPPFSDGRAILSASDCFFPVCSPAVAKRLTDRPEPSELVALPLIGSDSPDPKWLAWVDWFERVGSGRKSLRMALHFNHYTDGIAAALGGQGIALGWDSIVGDLVAAGQLVRVGERVNTEATYNVMLPLRDSENPAVAAFVNWIATMFDKGRTPVDPQG